MCIFKTARNMAAIPHYDLTLDAAKIEDGAKEIIRRLRPSWNLQSLQFQHFTEGLCNVLVGCYQPDDRDNMVLVRVFGEKTEIMVDREAEKEMFVLLSKAGCSPPLYCTFNNGIVYGFVVGKPLDMDMVKEGNIRVLIAKEMAKLHTLKKDSLPGGDNSNPKPYIFTKMQDFLNLIPDTYTDKQKQSLFVEEFKSKAALQGEFEMLRNHLQQLDCEVVLCHNDLLLANIIFDSKTNKIGFIDFEYAFYNYQAFDIGNHFNEYAGISEEAELDFTQYPKREYQLSWIRTYLEEYNRLTAKQTSPSEREVERLYIQANKCALASNFLWGTWALIQVELSKIDFDYFKYAAGKFREYFRRRDEFLSLTEL